MRKPLFLLWAVMACVLVSCSVNRNITTAAAETEETISLIEGVWDRGVPAEINLYRIKDGKLDKIASAVPDDQKRFYFAFPVESEKFYVIGTGNPLPTNHYAFYFKPGDRLRLAVGKESYELTGSNTPENMEVARWHEWILPLESRSLYFRAGGSFSTFEDFFPLLEEKLAEGYTAHDTGNRNFDEAFDHFRQSYFVTVATTFLMTPRTKHPTADDFPNYYKNLDIRSLTTARMLDYPFAIALLNQYPMTYVSARKDLEMKNDVRTFAGSLEFMPPLIIDDQLRGEFLLAKAAAIKTYEGYMDFGKKYGAGLVTEDQKERFKKMLKDIPIPEASPAVDFRFPDAQGNMVALSDFKGKVVYIDVWATWCGPCKSEIPHLKKLEQEYHDNPDIVFMSVSTDKAADRQKWLDMLVSENLTGVQLMAGDNSRDILDPYKITGIPRFMLVGKDGNMININAPRPSSTEIRPVLEAILKK